MLAHAQQSGCPSDITGIPDAQLQALLDICEREIADRQGKLVLTQKQATTIESIIEQLKYKIQKSELEIKARKIKIAQLGDKIVVTQNNISALSMRIGRLHDSISEILRKSRELSDSSPIEALLSNQNLSQFFLNVDNYKDTSAKLNSLILDIKNTRIQTEGAKKTLETSQTKETELKYEQEQLKKQTESYKSEQQKVLNLTQAQANAYKREIADRERIKNEIKNRIFRTVGGQELRFEDALKLVRMYESRIGVNASLTLAVLSQESSVDSLIGKNIGKCTYNQSASNSSNTVMSPTQQVSFLAITSELGLDPNTTPVSCPIYSDGAYGGAMGPAQFMPSTWWDVNAGTGYKGRVAQVMGVGLVSPFKSLDAFTGTALYLSDAQTRCQTAFTETFKIRACTAAKYYAGLTVSGSRLSRHMNPVSSYGYQVASRATQFDKDITLLDQWLNLK